MKKMIIAMMLAVTMIITSGCSPQQANDKKGNISVDSVSAGNQNNVLKNLPTKWDLTDLYADENTFEADMKRIEEPLTV